MTVLEDHAGESLILKTRSMTTTSDVLYEDHTSVRGVRASGLNDNFVVVVTVSKLSAFE